MPTLHLTSKRNQRDFAWPGALLADREEPTWPEIRAAVDSLAEDAGPVYLTGGEPTMRRDVFAVLDQLANVFPERDFVLVSNGRTFCYDRLCDALAAIRATRLTVEVWIASTRREVHDRVTGVAESLDQANRGIQQLLARHQRTRVRVLVGRHNVEHLHEIAACIPDRFAGIEGVVWDVAALATPGSALRLRPNEAASYLESALNLLRARRTRATVVGVPACALSEKFRSDLDRTTIGAFRDECTPCQARAECPGLLGGLGTDAAFHVDPIVTKTTAEAEADYAHYLSALLHRYAPPRANAVLDAMCGQSLRNLPILRRVFGDAMMVHGTDVDLDPRTKSPAGTAFLRADLLRPLPTPWRYDFIALFKPAANQPGLPSAQVFTNLVAALQPGGYLLIVLAEHTDVDDIVAVLRRLDVALLTSEPNALRTNVEPEHKWVIVCRAGGGASWATAS